MEKLTFITPTYFRYSLLHAALAGSVLLSGTASASPISDNLTFSGYLETYYSADNNDNGDSRPSFTYSHDRTNQVSINLAMMGINYDDGNTRANISLGAGSYMNANYSAESDTYQHIFEANVGVKLSDNKNLWLDVGLLPSHIGFESAIGQDNWTVTRSILADNSPYFETGARLSYSTPSGNWYFAALVVNGWQRIEPVDGSNNLSFGHQVTYTPNDSVLINSSSFIGSDTEQDLLRVFHNLYGIFKLNEKLSVTLAFDYGREERADGIQGHNNWMSPTLVAQYALRDNVNLAFRLEHYRDDGGVIVQTPEAGEFSVTGLSANVDYQLADKVWWRNEIRYFHNSDTIFVDQDRLRKTDTMFTTALTFSF